MAAAVIAPSKKASASSASSREIKKSLHSHGYVVLSGVFDFSDRQLSQLNQKFDTPEAKDSIFNETETKMSDGKRLQKNVSASNSVYPMLSAFFTELFPGLSMRNLTALCSLPGCQRQVAHCDYIPTLEMLDTDDDDIPLLSLIGIQDNTHIDIWEKSHKVIRGFHSKPIARKTLTINRGDVVIFRADCVHAGSEYSEKNVRLHCFLDSESIDRKPNVTWKIYKHAPEYVARCILDGSS